MHQILRMTVVIVTALCLFACQENGEYKEKRTEEEYQQLQDLNESMLHKSPNALHTIQQRMKEAKDSLSWYDYYLMYGRHYLISETPEQVIPYVDRTIQFINQLDEQTPRTKGLAAVAITSKAAYHYLLHHSADTVMALYFEAFRLMAESDFKKNLPDLAANIGDVYVAKGDLPEGARWYRKALYLNDSLGLPDKQALSLYMGLGRIYTTVGDFGQAKSYYEMTDKRFDELTPHIQSYFLNNYGNYYYFSRKYKEALSVFRRMKAHLEKYDAEQNFDMYLCKINMADVFLNLGQTDSARIYVAEAEQYFRKQNVDVGIYYAQTIRIGIALKENKLHELKEVLEEAEGLEVNDLDMKSIRNKYMNQYYAAIGDYEKAYAGLSVNTEQKDSTEFERKNMRSSDIMLQLTEDTIRLHHQLELNKREIHYEKTRTVSLVILSILIITILLFIIRFNHERKRRLQTELDMLTLRIANTRQRVSPHFVFNVLNSRIAKAKRDESDQLIKLAHLIRTNLDLTQKNNVTLDEELDFASQYVTIERNLIGEDFEFNIEAPDKEVLKNITIPSMLVQILVENAILHGLKDKEGCKKLTIKVEVDDKATRISVSDNGAGFDIRQVSSERSRTGLNIIRSTVSAINQENKKLKMRFDIKNDNGCHAILTIPRNIKLI